MDGDIGKQIIIILALIVFNGVFSMAELAIVNARKSRLEESADKGNKGAALAIELADNPNQMFSTIQIGITLIGIVTGLYGGATLSEPMAKFLKHTFPSLAGYADSLSPFIIVAIITYLSLVIGELVPKRLAYNNPEGIASVISRPMHFFSIIARPVVAILSLSTDAVLKLMGITKKEETPVTEAEIKKMLTQGAEMGAFEKEEPELVDNVFRLADLNAADVMTPRTQLKWIDLNSSENEIRDIISTSNHYRLPVGIDSLDDLQGLITVSDVFARQLQTHNTIPLVDIIKSCTKEPLMVPESITLMKLLEQFRTEGVHETIVLDEYGGFSGLVTLHDIMEEIIGIMPAGEDEKQEEKNRIIKRSENTWLVDGLLSIDEFKEYFSIEDMLPGEEEDLYKTVGGFATYSFGRIPKETDLFNWEQYTFEVVDMDNVRIDKLLITYTPPEPDEEDEAPVE